MVKRPLKQRIMASAMALLTMASTAWGSMGTTAMASATDLWDSETGDEELFSEQGSSYDEDYFEEEGEDLFEDSSYASDAGLTRAIEDTVLTSEDNDASVQVKADGETLADATDVKIMEMPEEIVSEWQEMFDGLEDENSYEVIGVYDVALVDEDGADTEPDGLVEVTITGQTVAEAIMDDRELRIYHMPDSTMFYSMDGESSGDGTGFEELASITDGAMSVTFNTDGFSQFAMVLTGNASQKEVDLGGNTYMELDKYLKETGVGLNNQMTYEVYLENAYYDPNPGTKLPNAPIRSDFFLIMDHSASMSDVPCVNLNVAVDAFLKTMQRTNQKRVKIAANGGYYDIDPAWVAETVPGEGNTVVVKKDDYGNIILRDVATLKSVMGEHMQYLTGAVSYNNKINARVTPNDRVAIYTDDERKSLIDLSYWEEHGRYFGKLGTNWGHGHNSTAACYGSGKLLGIPDYGAGDACLDDMTRTDMGTKTVYNWIFRDGNNGETYTTHRFNDATGEYDGEKIYTPRIVLATDGAPAGWSNEVGDWFEKDKFDHGPGYDYIGGSGNGSWMIHNVSPLNANTALKYINLIKNLDQKRVTSYVTYVNMESDPSAQQVLMRLYNAQKSAYDAKEASYENPSIVQVLNAIIYNRMVIVKDLIGSSVVTIAGRDGVPTSLTSIFMTLYSSCVTDGYFKPQGSADSITSISFNPNSSFGYSPDYFKFYNNASDIPQLSDIVEKDNLDASTAASDNIGYANVSSYVVDEITDPFEITSVSDIQVFAVPRIPANMSDGMTPDNLVSTHDEDGREIFYVPEDEFRWGERYVAGTDESSQGTTEWIDVTDDVNINVDGNRVKVTNYNYEANAVQIYDKDQFRRWPVSGNGVKYKTGDYGYKLVVIIPINAKFTFGGNGIKTNNTDVSGFYPSEPTGTDSNGNPLPKWEENTTLNPSGEHYMELYPECSVDLTVSYDIPYDSATIYAPQTKKLHDLVTDSVMNSMWYADAGYSDAKTLSDNAKIEYTLKDKELKAHRENMPVGDEAALQAWAAQDAALQEEVERLKAAYEEANARLNDMTMYQPDGRNNAFVNIEYQLFDPDGQKVGWLTVPHGKAYVVDAKGNGNFDWTFKDGPNAEITKSGVYRVEAVVSPCDTDRSSTWYVYTEADPEFMQAGAEPSTSVSSTGSSASGSQKPLTIRKEMLAKLFQLHIVVEDTRQETREIADFEPIQSVLLKSMIGNETNKHVVSYKWVCIDGDEYQSVQKEEPEFNRDRRVSDGDGVHFNAIVPPKGWTDNLVKCDATVGNVLTITADDGKCVPVSVVLARFGGSLNKGDKYATDLQNYKMTDSDNKYGQGRHSVVWEHLCDCVDDCDHNEFATANTKYGTPEGENTTVTPGPVRFLVHVSKNPPIEPTKSTTTKTIIKGQDIEWEVNCTNNDAVTNPNHRVATFKLFDVLPYNHDERNSELGIEHGTNTNTDLFYKTVAVDYSKSVKAKEYVEAGKGKLYYTTDIGARGEEGIPTAEGVAMDRLVWTAARQTGRDGDVISYQVPADAVAVRVDTMIAWKEGIKLIMTANVKDGTQQNVDDNYVNDAQTWNGKNWMNSNPVETVVQNLAISGYVWVDEDTNGLMTSEEERLKGVKVTLYQKYDPKNPKDEENKRVINGIELVPAYDVEHNMYTPVMTGRDGSFLFDDIQKNTYYVVADLIPDEFQVTKKHAGEGQGNNAKIDSEAEESFVDAPEGDKYYVTDNHTVWIKEINVSGEVQNQNIGLKRIRGTINVGKILDEIYFPSDMTDEQRAEYRVPFVFTLKNVATGKTYTKEVFIDQDNMRPVEGQPQVWTMQNEFGQPEYPAAFTDLPLGTYELTEVHDAQYEIKSVNGNSDKVRFDKGSQKVTIQVTSDEYEFNVIIENGIDCEPPGGDKNGVRNLIKVAKPIKLEVKYVGADPIRSTTLTEYTFQASDFDPKKGGDMIVTYDDGTTRSISAGTLKFSDVTLAPATVYNTMNTPDGRKLGITAYYSERGHLLTDMYSVGVDLAPLFKFHFKFDANGSSFNPDNNSTEVTHFVYDPQQKKVFVTSGTYKDTNNGGLKAVDSFWFAGWNTKPDGSGMQLGTVGADGQPCTDVIDFMNELCGSAEGQDTIKSLMSASGGVLYANWRTNVTFNANGGTIRAGGTCTPAEQTFNGQAQGQVAVSRHVKYATNMDAVKNGYRFVMWNTKADGTGMDMADYMAATKSWGPFTGTGIQAPVTFYAIYYQSDYSFTGSVQTFTAPVNGIYQMELWGAPAGGSSGQPGYTKLYIEVKQQALLYCFVGGTGKPTEGNEAIGGWNGGGATVTCFAGPHGGSGGGMTHISYTNNLAREYHTNISGSQWSFGGSWNPDGTIGVASGCGYKTNGGADYSDSVSISYTNLRNPFTVSGSSQTQGYMKGVGEGTANSGGGGGGWYGGRSAGFSQQTGGGNCGNPACGGVCYITPAGYQTSYSANNKMMAGGSVGYPVKPNSPEVNGYIRVLLIERIKP